MIDASPAVQATLRTMTTVPITGTITYQAGNDALCFVPQTVPLAWNVALRVTR